MIDFENKLSYDISDLRKIMRLLRGEHGCPWDREQTHESIRRNLLEEAYEAASAIDEGNSEDLLEELGDILLQSLFHADIAEDEGAFTFDDVIDATCKKLLRRHPHVFNGVHTKDSKESINVWEEAKRQEKQHETISDSMDSVARALPALWRAEKIQSKAAKAGFDWSDYTGALQAVHSELSELEAAIAAGSSEAASTRDALKEELGDLLFSVVNTARFFGIDPEDALNASSDKFVSRFEYVEHKAAEQGKKLTNASSADRLTLDEMEALYQKAKLKK